MANELFSKENLLKYTPTNVIKMCFAVAFVSLCAVFVIMMMKAADIPLGQVFKAYTDVKIRKLEGESFDHEPHDGMKADIKELKKDSHAPNPEAR
jgi:hypothetical protein